MASKIKYEDVRLEVADKGFILSFVELREKPGKQSADRWENPIRDYKKEVFLDGTKAVSRMTELAGKSVEGGNSEKAMPKEG